jgi:hypothetical protein
MNMIIGLNRHGEMSYLFSIHKDSDVFSDRVLFRDNAESDAGIPTVESDKHFLQGGAVCRDLTLPGCVRA